MESFVTTYTYDANNRLTTESKAGAAGTETTRYAYDPNGNQYSKTRETVSAGGGSESVTLALGLALVELYRYNGFNQMVSASMGVNTVTYSYYPSGLRAAKTSGMAETRYILDGGNVALETVGASVTASAERRNYAYRGSHQTTN